MTPKHLVMLSGGADSVKALLDAVTCDGEVVAYHVVMTHSCRRHHERRAARSIVDYVNTHQAPGRVRYLEATVSLPSYAHRDLLFLIGFTHNEAAMAAMQGRPYSDIWFGDGAIEPGEESDYFDIDRRLIEIFNLMSDPSTHLDLIQHQPTFHSQTAAGLSKQQARDAIGEPLWALTWGCRCPVRDKPCGKCFTCKERAATHASA